MVLVFFTLTDFHFYFLSICILEQVKHKYPTFLFPHNSLMPTLLFPVHSFAHCEYHEMKIRVLIFLNSQADII